MENQFFKAQGDKDNTKAILDEDTANICLAEIADQILKNIDFPIPFGGGRGWTREIYGKPGSIFRIVHPCKTDL